MTIWTKNYIFLSADKQTYFQYDSGAAQMNVYVNGTQVGYWTSTGWTALVADVQTGALNITSNSANSFSVGLNGTTNPVFNIDSSTTSAATGFNVKGAAAGAGLAVSVISSGSAENLTIDAKGTGTITLGGTSTGGITLTRATTPTAGIVAAGGFSQKPYNINTARNASATEGTDKACTNGTVYVGSIQVPANCTITGIGYLVGSVGGTTKVVAALYDSAGNVLANTTAAGTVVGTAAQTQEVALTAPYSAVGPATYFVGLTFDSTTAKFRTVPAYCNGGMKGGSATQTFGTPAAITPPTTFTADTVPFAYIY